MRRMMKMTFLAGNVSEGWLEKFVEILKGKGE